MKFLIYILFLATVSCYAGETIGDTYFNDSGRKFSVRNDNDGRYYVDGGQKCRIDGISGAESVYWDGIGYFDAIRQCYVNSPTDATVIVSVVVLSNGYDACDGGVGYISNGGFPYFNNSNQSVDIRGNGPRNGHGGGYRNTGGGNRYVSHPRSPGFSRPVGIGSHNSSGGRNFSVDRGGNRGYSGRK